MAPSAGAVFNDDSHAGFEMPVVKRAHNSQSKVNVCALMAGKKGFFWPLAADVPENPRVSGIPPEILMKVNAR